jgi:hypothetical protein
MIPAIYDIVEAARILGFSESYLRSGFAIERSQV